MSLILGRRFVPKYIGRYRTPRRLGRAVRTFRRRSSALRNCYRLARARRARAFAVRAGVSCYLSKMTSVKFTRLGKTRVGGLKVYVIRRGGCYFLRSIVCQVKQMTDYLYCCKQHESSRISPEQKNYWPNVPVVV